MKHRTPVVIVAAMSREKRAIGRENGLLWHIPEDLQRFRDLTLGYPIIMGRKTFESILSIIGKPLPNRTNIVVTRNQEYTYDGVLVFHSFEEALEHAENLGAEEIHIGGGSEMYRLALPYTDRLHLTFVDDEPESDTFFPEFAGDFAETRRHDMKEHNGITYEWVDYKRFRG